HTPRAAGSDSVIIDGSPWTREQLDGASPIFNKHDHFCCSLVIVVDTLKTGESDFYIAPPEALEKLLRPRALELAARPKRDGTARSVGFRKELPRKNLVPWRQKWDLLGKPLSFATPHAIGVARTIVERLQEANRAIKRGLPAPLGATPASYGSSKAE